LIFQITVGHLIIVAVIEMSEKHINPLNHLQGPQVKNPWSKGITQCGFALGKSEKMLFIHLMRRKEKADNFSPLL